MSPIANELITLGCLLLLALFAEAVGRHTRLPRISLLILLGFVLGPAVFELIEPHANGGFELLSILALSMVGFLVGGKLSLKLMRSYGRLILWLSLCEVLVTFAIVSGGLIILSFPTDLALLLGAIATATDPAATMEAIRELRRGNAFTKTLTGIVAIDDAWGLILFSLVIVILQTMTATELDAGVLGHGMVELFGAILLGFSLGLPMALLSGRIRKGEPTLMEALGMVLVCAGISQWLHLSHILACVALGATVVNTARHHRRPFHAIEEIEWPFLALFFIYSGAHLTLNAITSTGGLLIAYIVLRIAGRVAGGWLGAIPRNVDTRMARWTGIAMLPQAGVAMAMAFLGVSLFPALAETLIPAVIAATILFELLGPIVSRYVVSQSVEFQTTTVDPT